MSEFQHGDHVRIEEYGGEDASRNDKLYNGATGTVDMRVEPGVYYIRVELDQPVTTSHGETRTDVLCAPHELYKI